MLGWGQQMMDDSFRLAGELSETQVSDYRDKGYLALRRLFTPVEVHAMQSECDRLWSNRDLADADNLRAQTRPTVSGPQVIDRLDPVIDVSPLFRSAAYNPRLVSALQVLLDDEPKLFKDKLIFKQPGTNGYRVHQDYTYWLELPAPPHGMVTVAIALDAADPQSGAVEFYPGFHHRHYGPAEKPKDIFNPAKGLMEADLTGRTPELIPLDAGDVVIFTSLTPHQSGANTTTHARRVLFFSYSAAQYGDLYARFYDNFHTYLRSDRASAGNERSFFK